MKEVGTQKLLDSKSKNQDIKDIAAKIIIKILIPRAVFIINSINSLGNLQPQNYKTTLLKK